MPLNTPRSPCECRTDTPKEGFQVAPAELEGLLITRDDIADVCVLGVHDPARASEVPRAYIVPAPGVQGDAARAREIAEWLAGRVAAHKRLRGGVRFVDEIPKSPSGKILRRVLKERAGKEGEASAKL